MHVRNSTSRTNKMSNFISNRLEENMKNIDQQEINSIVKYKRKLSSIKDGQ